MDLPQRFTMTKRPSSDHRRSFQRHAFQCVGTFKGACVQNRAIEHMHGFERIGQDGWIRSRTVKRIYQSGSLIITRGIAKKRQRQFRRRGPFENTGANILYTCRQCERIQRCIRKRFLTNVQQARRECKCAYICVCKGLITNCNQSGCLRNFNNTQTLTAVKCVVTNFSDGVRNADLTQACAVIERALIDAAHAAVIWDHYLRQICTICKGIEIHRLHAGWQPHALKPRSIIKRTIADCHQLTVARESNVL